MAKAVLTGRVTRLIAADEARGIAERLFFWPNDRDACRFIDGRHQAASGELHVFCKDVSAYKVGGACAVEYDPDEPGKTPKLVPVDAPAPAPAPAPAAGNDDPTFIG
jgi:hypothetical protein